MTTPIPDWALAAALLTHDEQITTEEAARTITDHWQRATQLSEGVAELKAATLRRALVGLVGADSATSLDELEGALRLIPAPDEDKALMLNAIHALKATL